MDWKEHGVKIVHARELDMNTPQTSGMTRAAAITMRERAQRNYGRARWSCSRMRRRDRIIMVN